MMSTAPSATRPQPTGAQPIGLKVTAAQFGSWLYLTNLLIELPGVLIRYALVSGFFWFVGKFSLFLAEIAALLQSLQSNVPTPQAAPVPPASGGIVGFILGILVSFISVAQPLAVIIGWGPVLMSLASFILPGGFFFKRFGIGARTPSLREREAIQTAMDTIIASSPQGKRLKLMRDFYIFDS